MRSPRVRTFRKKDGYPAELHDCPNAGPRCNVTGMRNLYWGRDALLVRCGPYVYNVTGKPHLYELAA